MYTILGATGNVGGKIADILMKKGEKVRLVARSLDRLRAKTGPAVELLAGTVLDTDFLVKAFTGSDAVFTLVPPDPKTADFIAYADAAGESIAQALKIARVKHVVNLSSVGAELPSGTGPITGLHNQEERLNRIAGLHVLHLRAGYFMENLLMNIGLIRAKGISGSAVRGDIDIPMIASRDIASHAAMRLMKRDFIGSSVQYLLGERNLSLGHATDILGRKVGIADLGYVTFPYEEAEKGMIAAGLSPDMSRRYVEMSRAFNEGRIVAKRTADTTTPTAFETFCDEVFVPAYTQAKAA